jgi:Tfp pilus assembly protein PilX
MRQKKQDERGVALILALIALLILTSIGLSMMFMADTETSINSNYRDAQTAYYAAKAGLEEARDRMRSDAGATISASLPTALPGAVGGALYILNATGSETVAPWLTTNAYWDDEICKEVNCSGAQVPTGSWYTTLTSNGTYAASPVLPYKWARITIKTNRSASGWSGGTQNFMYVDGQSGHAAYYVCWNGTNEVAQAAACSANNRVYVLTALAVTPSGTRRMLQEELTQTVLATVPVNAAIYSNLAVVMGDALNVTGNTDPVCASPNVYGGESGTLTVTQPGSGNVTGSPAGTRNNAGWPYNIPNILTTLYPSSALDITSTGTGVTGTGVGGAFPPFTGDHAVLGVAPTVTYNSNGAVSAISAQGTPKIYYSSGNLTLGTNTIGGAAVTGQGVLLVNGNLTIDVTNGFNYFGAIIVTGNITMQSNGSSSANPHIHGIILNGGSFSAPISNFGGSISIHQNACFVTNSLTRTDYRMIANREMMY